MLLTVPLFTNKTGPVVFALMCPWVLFHLHFGRTILMLLLQTPATGGKSPQPSCHCPDELWLLFQVWLGQAIVCDSRTKLPCHPRWNRNVGWRRPTPFTWIHLISKTRREKIDLDDSRAELPLPLSFCPAASTTPIASGHPGLQPAPLKRLCNITSPGVWQMWEQIIFAILLPGRKASKPFLVHLFQQGTLWEPGFSWSASVNNKNIASLFCACLWQALQIKTCYLWMENPNCSRKKLQLSRITTVCHCRLITLVYPGDEALLQQTPKKHLVNIKL